MKKSKFKIVTLQIMVEHSSNCAEQPFYSIAVEPGKNVGYFAKRNFRKNVTGHAGCTSLIYALTQDAVLEAINTLKGGLTR